MKKFFTAIVFAVGLGSAAMAQVGTTGPVITIDKEVHDYGTIPQNADGACVFTVTNTGNEPLIISRCKGSCGCTVPQCSADPIAPGAKSEISVVYDTKRVGPINKSVTITSNATNEPTKVIRIKGTVEATDMGATGSGVPERTGSVGAPTNN